MNSKAVTPAQIVALQSAALPVLRGAAQFAGCSDAEIIEHVMSAGHTKKNWIADSWLNCVVSSFSKNVSIPASQESRAWDGIEGGHVLWDSRESEAMARELAARCGITLK